MDADLVVAAMRRHVLRPAEHIERRWDDPASVTLRTRRHDYVARRAEWAIAGEPWVQEALRVLADRWTDDAAYPVYGLLFPHDGDAIFLNDVAAMRRLGRRLGDGLDPLAYAELLAELHSREPGPAVAHPQRPGRLIRDPGEFLDRYPFVDPALPRPPAVRDGVLTFRSFDRYLLAAGSALDVYDWTVTASGWTCRAIARRLETP